MVGMMWENGPFTIEFGDPGERIFFQLVFVLSFIASL
jgi:hypothetical protein